VHGFEWLGSYPALIAFSVATCLEIAGYYIPWVDHLLDTMATPAAVIAGTIASASVIGDISPLLKWTLAAIAGGGSAGLIQGTTVVLRGASTATTAGLANPVVATAELAAATGVSLVALVAPLLAAIVVVGLIFLLVRTLLRRSNRARTAQVGANVA
jgi:hypothetical protein